MNPKIESTQTVSINHGSEIRVLVLGGGYAGVLTALRLAGKTRRQPVRITLINGRDHFVERIRLHQVAAGQTVRPLSMVRLLSGTGIDFVPGWVTELDPQRNTVTVQRDQRAEQIGCDYLIYALGSTIDMQRMPGAAEHALALTGEGAAARLHETATSLPAGAHMLVVGGGLTGIEAATELAEAYPHLQLMLATRGRVGAGLSARGGDHVRSVLRDLGVDLLEETPVARIDAQHVETVDGRSIPVDATVWAGAFVVPQLAQASGLPTSADGRIQVDATLRSVAHDNIYAVGDAAETRLRMACATAMPMGAYAADHLAARIHGHTEPAPFQFGYVLQCISLGRRRGLVQFVNSDDSPKDRIVTGWLGARIKEFVCRYTIWSLQLEKRMPGAYQWLKADLPLVDDGEPLPVQRPSELLHEQYGSD